MIRQKINGKITTINAIPAGADDLTALKGLLTGEIEVFELKIQGGNAPVANVAAENINAKHFIVGKKAIAGVSGRISAYIRIPHAKQAVNLTTDVAPLVVGKFNADFETAAKADYITLKFDRG